MKIINILYGKYGNKLGVNVCHSVYLQVSCKQRGKVKLFSQQVGDDNEQTFFNPNCISNHQKQYKYTHWRSVTLYLCFDNPNCCFWQKELLIYCLLFVGILCLVLVLICKCPCLWLSPTGHDELMTMSEVAPIPI